MEKSPQGGKTRDIVAEKVGIGGKETYRKEKYIVDNQLQLAPLENIFNGNCIQREYTSLSRNRRQLVYLQ